MAWACSNRRGGRRRRVRAQLEIEVMGRTHGEIAGESRGSRNMSYRLYFSPDGATLAAIDSDEGRSSHRPRKRRDSPDCPRGRPIVHAIRR